MRKKAMIRKAAVNDIDSIMDIWLTANLQAHSFISDDYWKDHFEQVRAAISEAEVYLFEDTTIMGFAGMVDNYIAGIFVKEEFRSQGIGTALIRFLQHLKSELVLDVYQKNQRAVAFYLKHGFTISQEKNGEEADLAEYQMVWKR